MCREQHAKMWTLEHMAYIVTTKVLKAKNKQFLSCEFNFE
jgi:hypothetical protein